jgi:hypothetical protein
LGSPYQYPWVAFRSVLRQSIDSTEYLLYKAPSVTIFDSIIVTNLTEQDIFIDFRILGERIPPDLDDPEVEKPWVAYKRLVEKNQTIELLPTSQSMIILEAGDFAYCNSDYSRNLFSCIVSGRQLLETSIED